MCGHWDSGATAVFSRSSGSERARSSELFHSELLVFVMCLRAVLSPVCPLQFVSSCCSLGLLSEPVESRSEEAAFLEVLEVYFDFLLQERNYNLI